MSESNKENWIPIYEGIKNTSISEVEKAIANGLSDATKSKGLICIIKKLQINGVQGIKFELEVNNEYDGFVE